MTLCKGFVDLHFTFISPDWCYLTRHDAWDGYERGGVIVAKKSYPTYRRTGTVGSKEIEETARAIATEIVEAKSKEIEELARAIATELVNKLFQPRKRNSDEIGRGES